MDTSALALLSIDELSIGVPQGQILSLEPSEDLVDSDRLENSVGWTKVDSARVPVYQLTHELALTTTQKIRRVVAVLNCPQQPFAIMADELRLLNSNDVSRSTIPRAMRQADSPVDQLAVIDEQLICLTSAERLYDKAIATAVRQVAE